MKVVFVDETENSNHLPGFYGVCAVAVDSANYRAIRSGVEDALKAVAWSSEYEFKGTCLFSSSKGDVSVPVDRRIDAAMGIVGSTVGASNARCSSAFAWNAEGSSAANHVLLLEKAVKGALPRNRDGKRDKNVCLVFCDAKESVPKGEVSAAVLRALEERGYVILEEVLCVDSSCSRPGLLLADVVAYLAMWTYAGHLASNPQQSLFEESGGAVPARAEEKLATVQALLETGSGVKFLPTLPRS